MSTASDSKPSNKAAWFKAALIVAALGGALALLFSGGGAKDAFVYSKLVDEVVSKPAQFKDRELRVEGQLVNGSIKFREQPCEYRFVLEKEGQTMPVRFAQWCLTRFGHGYRRYRARAFTKRRIV